MTLEVRVCKCGCGKMFKCLPESSQEFLSNLHNYAYEIKKSESLRSAIRRGVRYGEYKHMPRLKSK